MVIMRWFGRLARLCSLMAVVFALVAAPQQASATTYPYPGMTVCMVGSTGFRCGYVLAVNVTVCDASGCLYGLASTNIYATYRDIGAPVYYGSERIGTVVVVRSGYTYFDPL